MPEKNKPTRVKPEHEINSATTENEKRKVADEHKEITQPTLGTTETLKTGREIAQKKKTRENIERY